MSHYYHATGRNLGKKARLKPGNYYEKVGKSGCPEPLGPSEYIGYAMSDIPEVSFSKSVAGAVTAIAEYCGRWNKKKCLVHVYETEEKPDLDLSDCPGDFSTLEEVRFRRPVNVIYKRTVLVPKNVVERYSRDLERYDEQHDVFSPESWDFYARRLKKAVKKVL